MSLEGWKTTFEIAGVGLLFLTFVAGAGALYFSNRVGTMKDDQLRKAADAFDRYKLETAGKVAEATKAGIAAGALAGNAQAGVAAANVELAKQQALTASASAEAAKATERANEANLATEKLRKENLELEASISPRYFKNQFSAAERLSAFAPLSVVIEFFPDWECQRTAGQIAFTLLQAGWTVPAIRGNADQIAFSDRVVVRASQNAMTSADARKVIAAAIALVAELNKTNITASNSGADPEMTEAEIVIRVGIKPNPVGERLNSEATQN